MKIESAGVTHVGRRSNNEDAFCAEPSLGLFVVADGMGGYEGGEVASRLVVDAVRAFVSSNAGDDHVTWPYAADPQRSTSENMVRIAIRLAQREVVARKVGRLASMGSTVALLYVQRDEAVIANVGDSRVYRLRDGRLEQRSRDHSLYAEMQAMQMAVGAREDFPYTNVITRAIGMPTHPEPDVFVDPIRAGDTWVLCSDGLTEPLDDGTIASILAGESVDAVANALVQRAFACGGRDNITAVVVRATDARA